MSATRPATKGVAMLVPLCVCTVPVVVIVPVGWLGQTPRKHRGGGRGSKREWWYRRPKNCCGYRPYPPLTRWGIVYHVE